MKKIGCIILLLSIFYSCSKNEEDQINYISRCFMVKDFVTKLPVAEARVSLHYGEASCYLGACGFPELGFGISDDTGQACITFDSSIKITHISCGKSGYYWNFIDNPSKDTRIIYLIPFEKYIPEN